MVNNYRKISERRLMKRWRKREDGDGKHKDTGGKEDRADRDGAEPSAGHGRERVALLTLFPRRSLQRVGITKRARGFRQWEGKKITSKLAAHLNLDNPKTVVLHAHCAGSDVSLIISMARPVLPFLAQI